MRVPINYRNLLKAQEKNHMYEVQITSGFAFHGLKNWHVITLTEHY